MNLPAIAYLNGNWVAQADLHLRVDDVGFFQSATAVERLRTWAGNLPPLDEHLSRFVRSTESLKICGLPSADHIANLIHQLLEKNSGREDVGITIFATPGRRGRFEPTLCLHLTTLDVERISRLQHNGQPLVVTSVQQPSPDCWPRNIKVRCRLHYYLADLEATDRIDGGLGVLLDTDQSITETSTSNIIILNGGTLCLPPADRVLPGIMAKIVCRLATEAGLRIERRVIQREDLYDSEEVWLTGSEVGLWFASQIDDHEKPVASTCLDLQKRLIQTLSHT